MEDTPQAYYFRVTLALKHPSASLSYLSKALGLEPLREWRSGEPRTSPRGRALEGLWSDSYWAAQLPFPRGAALEEALEQLAADLEPHRSLLQSHRSSGGTAYLLLGVFLEDFNGGFSIAPELLARYASLGLALDFDLYAPEGATRDAP
jgi:hypothetical protein